MTQWEHEAIDLNDVSIKVGMRELLNDLGSDGWELVTITPNNIAYLKRMIAPLPAASSRKSSMRHKTISSEG